jgi:transcription antitermination protein NusB
VSDSADSPRRERRRRAREAALHALYQCEVGGLGPFEATRLLGTVGAPDDAPALDDEGRAFAATLAMGTWTDRVALDERIGDAARNWRVERMAVVDRLLLRMALQELLAHPETPPRVVIDEAIELTRAYSGEEAARFVNGVLDGAFKRLKEEGKVIDA